MDYFANNNYDVGLKVVCIVSAWYKVKVYDVHIQSMRHDSHVLVLYISHTFYNIQIGDGYISVVQDQNVQKAGYY